MRSQLSILLDEIQESCRYNHLRAARHIEPRCERCSRYIKELEICSFVQLSVEKNTAFPEGLRKMCGEFYSCSDGCHLYSDDAPYCVLRTLPEFWRADDILDRIAGGIRMREEEIRYRMTLLESELQKFNREIARQIKIRGDWAYESCVAKQ